MNDSWSEKRRYLEVSRFRYHNDDYIEFLVRRVWELNAPCRMVDFGCGRGYLAALLDPFLAPGSEYTGLDVAESLLKEARSNVPGGNAATTFVQADAGHAPFPDGSFDVAICHALLMHLSAPVEALREMMRVTRPGGLIICCEANRSAVNASLFVAELPGLMDLGLLQRFIEGNRELSGKDPDIGAKLPVLFQQLGLKNIQARMTDSVRCVLPPLESAEQKSMFEAVRSEMPQGISEEVAEVIRARFAAAGLTRSEADQQIQNERRQAEEFSRRGETLHTVMPQMMLFCSGRVP
jgi:SAM-dependent methyltransferase